jgi:hypothetical protein
LIRTSGDGDGDGELVMESLDKIHCRSKRSRFAVVLSLVLLSAGTAGDDWELNVSMLTLFLGDFDS